MKIAVVHNLPAGGMKRAVFELVKRLSRKHTIDLFTLSSANEHYLPLKPFVNKHIRIPYTFPEKFPLTIFSIYFELPHIYQKLAEKINSGGYDVALVYPCFLSQAPYILRYIKIPKIYFTCEVKREFHEMMKRVFNWLTYNLTLPFRYPLKFIDRINAGSADLIITCSKYSQETVDRIYGVHSVICPLGVDSELFKPLPTKKENMVITVGDFTFLKGHDFIIRSLSLINQNLRPKLTIVGNWGIDKEYFTGMAKKLEVELEVYESINDNDLVRLYNKAKCFVFAAYKEPYGLVVLEALSCGLPVVAVRDGAIPELLNNENLGYLLDRNEKEFAEKIEVMLRSSHDKKFETMRRDYVKRNFGWDKSLKILEKYLDEFIIF